MKARDSSDRVKKQKRPNSSRRFGHGYSSKNVRAPDYSYVSTERVDMERTQEPDTRRERIDPTYYALERMTKK